MDYPPYRPETPNQPLDDAELDALDRLLAELKAPGTMNIEVMDGYLTALLVGPPVLARLKTADWLPAIWGGDAPAKADGEVPAAPFASNKQRKRALVLALRHLQAIACALRDTPDAWQPIFSVAEQGEQEFVDAQDWCAGFLQAASLDEAAWSELFDDPSLGPWLVPIAVLGGDDSALNPADITRRDDPAGCDELSRAVVDAVLHLAQRGR